MNAQTRTRVALDYEMEFARSLSPMVDTTRFKNVSDWFATIPSPIEAILEVHPNYWLCTVAAALVKGTTVDQLLALGVVRVIAEPEKVPSPWLDFLDPLSLIRRNSVVQCLFGPAFGQPYYLIQATA